jgi:hypothetical protein
VTTQIDRPATGTPPPTPEPEPETAVTAGPDESPPDAGADEPPDAGRTEQPPAPARGGKHRFVPRRSFPRGADGRTLSICGWATALGGVGVGSALRGLVVVLTGSAPTWYEPTLAGVGLGAIGLTAAAFLSMERRRLPWLGLGLATVLTGVNLTLTIATP